MNKPYFRLGAGSIIYRHDGHILIFKRTGQNVWQFQQGGIDSGEKEIETLWRELNEETGLIKQDFIELHPYPTTTTYLYPKDIPLPTRYKNCLGQKHHWWFLKINPDTQIDLDKAQDDEFENYQWISFADFLKIYDHSFKQSVYEELYHYYTTRIKPPDDR